MSRKNETRRKTKKMYYGSNRATAIALSTTLLAILLMASFASIPIAHGISGTVSPSQYQIFCDSTGDLTFTFDAGATTWYGVAIEIPKDFIGLVSGDVSKVNATAITQEAARVSVYDEELYYPYTQKYYWVQVGASPRLNPTWPGITGAKTVTLMGITAPSVARDYTVNLYYTDINFPCTTASPMDFSAGNLGTSLSSVTVKVHMREEASTISGIVSDTSYSPSLVLNAGYVTATANDGPMKGKVVAKTPIASNGAYTLTGLYNGTYKLTAWGKRTAVDTIAAYMPTELALPVSVGRRATLTGVNIAVSKGGEVSGNVRLYDGTSPVTPNTVFSGYFTLPNTGPGGTIALPVRVELVNSANKVVRAVTVNVPADASLVSYSIKELDGDFEYQGIPAGIYTLKAYAFGFVQTATVSVSVTAPGGVTIDVPLVKGGGVVGTVYYLTAQGTTYTLTASASLIIEAYNSTGSLKGVWLGTALTGQTSTAFLIRGTGESVTPVAGTGFTTIQLKTYSGRGIKDGGLSDGGYTIKVYVKSFIQPTPYPTAVISYAGTGSVSIYLKQGGSISGIIYAKDPTGVYAESWQRTPTATYTPWEWNQTYYPDTRIRAYVYDASGASVGYATVYQSAAAQTTTFSYSGSSSLGLQIGSKPTALPDGTYTIKVFTFGYWQATPYPTATIYSGGTQAVDCPVRRGGVVAGTITFKEAGITIPAGISGYTKVEAVDASGVVQGASFYTLSSATTLSYYIYGKYKYSTATAADKDCGLADGAYTVKLTLPIFAHLTQTVTVAGGSSATLNFDAYRMGVVSGRIRGAVTYQATPIQLSWVKITLSSNPTYVGYSADGSYSMRVPDGTYTMTFSAYGYKPYTLTTTVGSGATQVISADLVESFERIPEFPMGAVFALAASLGLALYLLRWTKKPIALKEF